MPNILLSFAIHFKTMLGLNGVCGMIKRTIYESAQAVTDLSAALSNLTILQVMRLCLDCSLVFQEHQT